MDEAVSRRRRRTFNGALVWIIPLFLLASAVPLASNRPFFSMTNAVILAILGGVYGLSIRKAGPSLATGLTWPLGLFLGLLGWMALQALSGFAAAGGIAALSPIASVVPSASVAMLVRYLSYAILFLLSVQAAARPQRAGRFLMLIFAVTVVEAGLAILFLVQWDDRILFIPKWAYQGYATGTFVNRNHLATFLAFGTAIGCVLLVSARRGAERRPGRTGMILVGLAANLIALAATGSRMGLAVTALGMTTALALGALQTRKTRANRAVLALGGLAGPLLVIGALVAHSGTFERLGSIEQDADVRLALYAQTIDLILDRPVTGHGAGSFEIAFNAVRRPPVSSDRTWGEAHNTYLELAAEIGIPATLALMVLLGSIAATCLRAVLRAEAVLPACTCALAVTVVAAVHSLVDFSLQIPANVYLLVAVLAAGLAEALSVDRTGTAAEGSLDHVR